QGNFFTAGQKFRLPERRKVYITVLDEPALVEPINKATHNPRILLESDPSKSALGLWAGETTVPDDFNEPLEDLKEYMY
ncbi:MAG: DUF2281 domain-containing protein, partial [Lachnospiraceae bacterium]|nr:DUF2281 domain-containing protein [Lachnospiraceae bacterium]